MNNEKLMKAIRSAANEIARENGADPIREDSVIERSDGVVVIHSENGDSAASLFFYDTGGIAAIDRMENLGARVADKLQVNGFFENEMSCTAIFYEC